MFRTIIQKLTNFKQFMSYGGITNVNVNLISHDNSLINKRILTTGGGTGIGLAIAKRQSPKVQR